MYIKRVLTEYLYLRSIYFIFYIDHSDCGEVVTFQRRAPPSTAEHNPSPSLPGKRD